MSRDLIADFLTAIRNAQLARHPEVVVASSRMCLAIAKILKEHGFIENFKQGKSGAASRLSLTLRYRGKRGVIEAVRRISKPGRRVYVKAHEIPRPLGGLGLAILSTSRGVMSGREARRRGLGGEVLCEVR